MSVQPLIERMMAVFGEPRTDSPELFLAEYRRTLKFYSADILERTADRVIDELQFWPRPSEVRKIAAGVAADMAARFKPAEHLTIEDNPTASPETKAAVDRLVRDALTSMKGAVSEAGPTPLQWLNAEEFRAMQEASPNRHAHRRPK